MDAQNLGFSTIRTLHVEAIKNIIRLKAERSPTNTPALATYTAILLTYLSKLKPKEFDNILRSHKSRLLDYCRNDFIVKVDGVFKQLKSNFEVSYSARDSLNICSDKLLLQ